ncbi:KilA-N domain-containing protein [Dyella jiangningensis]|uniref:DNA-binding protein n=1 Tax=Dyella jiangningensis TaxID=1379159 RepID=A0A328P1T6_9GAMM|nr:KilA-N domain-containing protein [Dyella jiangningensis]RAO74956.1 DNA-binding protein [Dyella jiangningensis]
MASTQLSLALIPHKVDNGLIIAQRQSDGYINATAMCQAVGKQFNDYTRLASTREYVDALSDETGIPVSELIQTFKGGDTSRQGSWVHPDLAIHLAQWLSPKFAVMVSKWVREWLAGGRHAGGAMPYHLQRYMKNRTRVPYTHFSVLNELTISLIAPLEDQGYTLPDNMVPDISQGKMFAKWLREKYDVDTDTLPTYKHEYADGRVVDAKLYPVGFLDEFRKHFHEVWMPTKATEYFGMRDQKALPYLEKIVSPLLTEFRTPALKAPKAKAMKATKGKRSK